MYLHSLMHYFLFDKAWLQLYDQALKYGTRGHRSFNHLQEPLNRM